MLVEDKGLNENRAHAAPVERVRDSDVEQAVTIDVAHGAGGMAEAVVAEAAPHRDVAEGAPALVLEQAIALRAPQHEQIPVAVVVDVAVADAGAVLIDRGDAGSRGPVHEDQPAGFPKLARVEAVRPARPVRHVDVKVAVVVEIEEGDARRAARLDGRVEQIIEREGSLIFNASKIACVAERPRR